MIQSWWQTFIGFRGRQLASLLVCLLSSFLPSLSVSLSPLPSSFSISPSLSLSLSFSCLSLFHPLIERAQQMGKLAPLANAHKVRQLEYFQPLAPLSYASISCFSNTTQVGGPPYLGSLVHFRSRLTNQSPRRPVENVNSSLFMALRTHSLAGVCYSRTPSIYMSMILWATVSQLHLHSYTLPFS